MDRAAFIDALTTEIRERKTVALQNHLYGCISALEQLAEGQIPAIDCAFEDMGTEYGFYDGSGAEYVGSEPYRAGWAWAWRTMKEDLDAVDSFEDEFLRVALKEFGTESFFAQALNAGNLGDEEAFEAALRAADADSSATPVTADSSVATEAPVNGSVAATSTSVPADTPVKRRARTRRAGRGITPLRKKRITAVTRRKKQPVLSS